MKVELEIINIIGDMRNGLRCQMLALFPEIMREGEAGGSKYNRAAAWLIKTHNIICRNRSRVI